MRRSIALVAAGILVTLAVALTIGGLGAPAGANVGSDTHRFVVATPSFTPKADVSNPGVTITSAEDVPLSLRLKRYDANGDLLSTVSESLNPHATRLWGAPANNNLSMHVEVWGSHPGFLVRVSYADTAGATRLITFGEMLRATRR
jgi:hypothetical protein